MRPKAAALIGVQHSCRSRGIAVGIDADGIEGEVGDAELEVFQQARLLHVHTVLDGVMSRGGDDTGLHAVVQELPLLGFGLGQTPVGRGCSGSPTSFRRG